jgi:transcriptional regulator with XRE-family HTH domain
MTSSPKEVDPKIADTISPSMARKAQSRQERDVNAALGKRLATLRKERGFTQVELAEKVGVVQAAISSYESGRLRPHPQMLLKLSEILELSVDQLLGRETTTKAAIDARVDRRFLRRLRLVKTLPKRDQDALLRTIDAFLAARKGA